MSDCPDCFKEQRTINEKLKLAIEDAQKLANTEKKEVAVFQTGPNFAFSTITAGIPAGTRQIVKPV
jgi:electron transfer flavoprotein alpha/beta subunit